MLCLPRPECFNEGLIKKTADAMVSEGYLAAGYEYVALDDCELRVPLPRPRPVPAAAAMLVVFQQCLPLALWW